MSEFRAVLLSSGLSILGDQVARLAVALLVYERGGSAFAASATYACSYLTWLVGGPALSALADRHRRRRLMVGCDLLRAALVAILVLPDVPLWVVFPVLVLVGVLAPPFDSAKSAVLPDLLEGERYIAGSAVINTMAQGAQVGGFALGGALVGAVGVQYALAVDAASFLLSGLVLAVGLRERPRPEPGGHSLAGDIRNGVRLVAGDAALRRLLGYGVLGSVAMIAPEGLAVPVTDRIGGGPVTAGVLTAAVPAGFLVGSFLLLRVPASRRLALVPRLTLVACLPLLLTPVAGSSWLLGALWLVCGMGGSLGLVVNAEYMISVSAPARGRAFGVAVTVLMAVQGLALLAGGALAEAVDPRVAVAALGGLAMTLAGWLHLGRQVDRQTDRQPGVVGESPDDPAPVQASAAGR